MIIKQSDVREAIARIPDGATVCVGGFGVPGTPFYLLQELVRHGAKDLTIVKNDANERGMGVDHMLKNGQVKKLIVTHIGLNANAIRMMNEAEIEVEFNPQGILAEKLRAAGAGLQGILTDVGIDTTLAEGKTIITYDGRQCIVEPPIKADFALIHAAIADQTGNVRYSATAQNFNPLMAMAADCVICEAEQVVEAGRLDADLIHTPSPFVDHVVEIAELSEEYNVIRR